MTLSRRDVLAAFLGAPLAALACARAKTPSLPPGILAGASDGVGHRLRGAPPPSPPADRWLSHEVVIVGAGVAGLAAAWRLRRAGIDDVVILELEPAIGGTSRSGESRVAAYPWGAHYVPVPTRENPDLIALLDELGIIEGKDAHGDPIVGEQFLCRDPQERVFYRGRWYEGLYLAAGASADDFRQLRRFESEVARWVAWRDGQGRRAFTIPIARGSDDAEVTALDRISMHTWMAQRAFTSPRLRWLVEYGCRDDYGSLLEDTSAWAALFYFASRVAFSGAESEPLITWPEGNARLVAHLARASRDRIKTGWLAADVIPTADGADVVALSAQGDTTIGFHAKHVIFAAPQFVAGHVIRPWRDQPPAHIREFEYGSWMVANLTLRDRPRSAGFPMAWDNVFYDSPSLGYVVATHQLDVEHGPTVLTYYYALCDHDPHAARRRLLSTGRDGWADVALADISRAHPDIRTLTERLDVMRWGHAMIRPRPGFIWSGARRAARQPLGHIHFAHSDLSGVALFEEAFYQGLRAADEVGGTRV
jgi:glycine/D-amino acid oxidase-like deaminating enzyme